MAARVKYHYVVHAAAGHASSAACLAARSISAIAGASVTLREASGTERTTTATQTGTFTFDDVPLGEYHVTSARPGSSIRKRRVARARRKK